MASNTYPETWRMAVACISAALLVSATPSFAHAQSTTADTANVCSGKPPTESAPSAGGVASAPLTVDAGSHVVVMEYEAWFGPDTGIAPQTSVTTCLQSKDMKALGGGYDSTDPAAIATHIHWLEQMGLDAVTLDLTNNVSCIFDGDNPAIIKAVCPDPQFRAQQVSIRRNDGHLYSAWTRSGTRLKIIPLLGGFDRYALTPDQDDSRHRSALEQEADWFGALMKDNPALGVIYRDKPLMLVYPGTPIDAHREHKILKMLRETGLDGRFTVKLIGGYLDSQPAFWADPGQIPDGPIEIAPRFGFWSIVDRLNFWGAPPDPYYPTYNRIGSRIENMTASLATAGQTGWYCTAAIVYCRDAALRYCGEGYQNGCDPGVYETFAEFMTYAVTLKPVFLILDQFNEFATPDEGDSSNSNDDTEPTTQWGYSGLRAVIDRMRAYRKSVYAASP